MQICFYGGAKLIFFQLALLSQDYFRSLFAGFASCLSVPVSKFSKSVPISSASVVLPSTTFDYLSLLSQIILKLVFRPVYLMSASLFVVPNNGVHQHKKT